jgi:hypothetical protein
MTSSFVETRRYPLSGLHGTKPVTPARRDRCDRPSHWRKLQFFFRTSQAPPAIAGYATDFRPGPGLQSEILRLRFQEDNWWRLLLVMAP